MLFISVTRAPANQQPSEPIPVIPLGHNERKVFNHDIENHDETDSKRIPQKEKGSEKHDDPVGQLSPTGFDQKNLKVGPVPTSEPLLGKTHFPEKRGSIGQIFLPFPHLENIIMNAPVSFPPPAPIKPVRRVKMLRRNPDGDINNTYVNKEPGDKINNNCPEGGEVDESHALRFLSRSVDDSSFPGHLSHKKDAKEGQDKHKNEEHKRDLKEEGWSEPEIPDSHEHPVDL
jgi:hypothetical protein